MDSFERLLWWLFAGSAGARTRVLIITSVKEQPKNAQQLSDTLKLDYTTVRHHLRTLETNKLLIAEGDRYGRLYFISEALEAHWEKLQEILEKTQLTKGVESRR